MPAGDLHSGWSLLTPDTVRDLVIGASDGLSAPFALTTGLSAVVASAHLIFAAGLLEVVAGATILGLGGYLAARMEAASHGRAWRRALLELSDTHERERAEVREILGGFGLKEGRLDAAVSAITAKTDRWADWMIRFELGQERPERTKGKQLMAAYVLAGLIPLAPYLIFRSSAAALPASVFVTAPALFGFGVAKARLMGHPVMRTALQAFTVAIAAAGIAYLMAKTIGA